MTTLTQKLINVLDEVYGEDSFECDDMKLTAEILIDNGVITSEDDFSKITNYTIDIAIHDCDEDAIWYLENECLWDSEDIEYWKANHTKLQNNEITVYIS